MTADTPFVKAVKILGGQIAVGKLLGVAQQTISLYASTPKPALAEWCVVIHRETEKCGDCVSCFELRPDIFPPGFIPPALTVAKPTRKRKAA